eukprot:3757157-Pyramimonas_sp.AAC.2
MQQGLRKLVPYVDDVQTPGCGGGILHGQAQRRGKADPAFPEEGRTAGQIRHTDKLWESGRRPRTANSARLDAWGGGKEE